MRPIYEFYPTFENVLSPTMDAADFDTTEEAISYGRSLLDEHLSAERIIVIREGEVVATIGRRGPAAASHLPN